MQDREKYLDEHPEELTVEDFTIPSLMRPGLGRVCDYCMIKDGRSVAFTSFNQYVNHVTNNHHWRYSIYALPEELERFKKEIADAMRKQMKHPKELRQSKPSQPQQPASMEEWLDYYRKKRGIYYATCYLSPGQLSWWPLCGFPESPSLCGSPVCPSSCGSPVQPFGGSARTTCPFCINVTMLTPNATAVSNANRTNLFSVIPLNSSNYLIF